MLNDEKLLDDPRRAIQFGLGFSSPLWPTFIAATSAGVAFWAWSQWLRGKAQSEFAPELIGAPAAAEPVTPPPVPQPIPEPVIAVAEVATKVAADTAAKAAETAEKITAPVTEAVSEAIGSSAAILADAKIEDPVELTPEALAAEEAVPEVPPAEPAIAVETEAAVAPLAAAAKPVRRKRADGVTEAAPEEAPAKAAVAAVAPRKVRAAKAAAEPTSTGPKRRNAPRRRS